jgi:rhodanese-related sulfurtransferase
MNVEEAMNLIEAKPNLIIVDVRSSQEYASGHIAGAVSIPITNSKLLLVNLRPTNEILIYCQSGFRSASAKQLLNKKGYERVHDMLGGIAAWKNAGYPITEE